MVYSMIPEQFSNCKRDNSTRDGILRYTDNIVHGQIANFDLELWISTQKYTTVWHITPIAVNCQPVV